MSNTLYQNCATLFQSQGAVISGSGSITYFLTSATDFTPDFTPSDHTATPEIVLLSGQYELSFGVDSTYVATNSALSYSQNASGVNTWTYENEFQITESSTGVIISYNGDIEINTSISYTEKDITIISFNGNIIIDAAMTAQNITLIAKEGVVSIISTTDTTADPSEIKASGDLVIFDNGTGVLTPGEFPHVTGEVLINHTLNLPSSGTRFRTSRC